MTKIFAFLKPPLTSVSLWDQQSQEREITTGRCTTVVMSRISWHSARTGFDIADWITRTSLQPAIAGRINHSLVVSRVCLCAVSPRRWWSWGAFESEKIKAINAYAMQRGWLQNSHIREQSPLSLVILRYVLLRVRDDRARGRRGGRRWREQEIS